MIMKLSETKAMASNHPQQTIFTPRIKKHNFHGSMNSNRDPVTLELIFDTVNHTHPRCYSLSCIVAMMGSAFSFTRLKVVFNPQACCLDLTSLAPFLCMMNHMFPYLDALHLECVDPHYSNQQWVLNLESKSCVLDLAYLSLHQIVLCAHQPLELNIDMAMIVPYDNKTQTNLLNSQSIKHLVTEITTLDDTKYLGSMRLLGMVGETNLTHEQLEYLFPHVQEIHLHQ